jgi:hypothetical protein
LNGSRNEITNKKGKKIYYPNGFGKSALPYVSTVLGSI